MRRVLCQMLSQFFDKMRTLYALFAHFFQGFLLYVVAAAAVEFFFRNKEIHSIKSQNENGHRVGTACIRFFPIFFCSFCFSSC